jgi:hypothetical protein
MATMARELPRAARGRLGLALAFLVLALLLAAAAAWAAGELRERSATDAGDARLSTTLRAASAAVRSELGDAATQARTLAASTAVQGALLRGDRGALRGLAEGSRAVTFELPEGAPVGAAISPLQRAVEVTGENGRMLGRVVVGVPVDETLIRRLRAAAGVPAGDTLAVARGDEFLTPPPVDGERRSMSAPLARGSDLRLVASAPAEPIADAAADMRRRARAAPG